MKPRFYCDVGCALHASIVVCHQQDRELRQADYSRSVVLIEVYERNVCHEVDVIEQGEADDNHCPLFILVFDRHVESKGNPIKDVDRDVQIVGEVSLELRLELPVALFRERFQ